MKTLKVGQRVKRGDEDFGTILNIGEKYSFKTDDLRMLVTVCWDCDGTLDHQLSEFNGGAIEELPTRSFELYFDSVRIGIAPKGEVPPGTIIKIELDEFELRRLIASAQAALNNAGC